ncbi:lipopolysaccharide heptosyltransferase I [Isoalcanivorax indicus]|uniref:lipopolysaccharide heptosyltransferase I n=1 Tax=Isoalcanivorax indicus TaxID=2202653 RepID=UPI000DB9AAC9|nr:lipopolysaccharide heptosyltransferase I [Isoalcanivorax indicus]
MTRILLIRMSSLGDIFHTFPALTDLRRARPDIRLDWVVEEAFAEAAAWHPAVDRVIPVNLRAWLRQPGPASLRALRQWREALRTEHYDRVVDSQGLLKSALVARQARRDQLHGFDRHSARESLAGLLTGRGHRISPSLHAIQRNRLLLAAALEYPLSGQAEFGLREALLPPQHGDAPLVFLPGTTWPSKLWPEEHWITLTRLASGAGHSVELLWGNQAEADRALRIAAACGNRSTVSVAAARRSLTDVAGTLAAARAVVGPDTGLTHLAAALDTPVIGLFGPTPLERVGLNGPHATNFASDLPCAPCRKRHCRLLASDSRATAPCMAGLHPEDVWHRLQSMLRAPRRLITTSLASADLA